MAKETKVREGDDADLGAHVARAAEQLALVGPAAVARVRFWVRGQWFECSLRMVDNPGVAE